jgi:hypothetical protein
MVFFIIFHVYASLNCLFVRCIAATNFKGAMSALTAVAGKAVAATSASGDGCGLRLSSAHYQLHSRHPSASANEVTDSGSCTTVDGGGGGGGILMTMRGTRTLSNKSKGAYSAVINADQDYAFDVEESNDTEPSPMSHYQAINHTVATKLKLANRTYNPLLSQQLANVLRDTGEVDHGHIEGFSRYLISVI